jgi:hypothetical protein
MVDWAPNDGVCRYFSNLELNLLLEKGDFLFYPIILDMSRSYNLLFVLTLVISLALPNMVNAQYNEAGITLGVSNYRGDLAQKMQPNDFNLSFGVMLRRNFTPRLSGRFNLMRGVLTGADRQSINIDTRRRNLSFRTDYITADIRGEWNLSRFDILDGKNSAPYLSAGIGAMYFNPQALYQGMYYDLQPLGTEGQGKAGGPKKYMKMAVTAPLGFGFRWALSQRIVFQVDAAMYFTMTDYLDDVSKTYADLDAMRLSDPLAAKLAYRAGELDNDMALANPQGLVRGDGKPFDRYFVGSVTVAFNLCDSYELEWNQSMRIQDEPKPAIVKKKKARKKLFKKRRTIEGVF